MLIELAMLTFAATSTGATAGPVASTPITAPIERPSALGDAALRAEPSLGLLASPSVQLDSLRLGPVLLAASGGSGSRGGRSSSKGSSSNRGAGGYQQSGQGGYQQTGQGGYLGGGQGGKPMDITPPNSTGSGIRTMPPMTPPWSPQWSPPGN